MMKMDLSLQLHVRQAVVKQLKAIVCRICRQGFQINSVTLVKHTPGAVVATIQCKHCGSPYGTAIIGYRSEDE